MSFSSRVVYVGMATFPHVLDLGGNYCCVPPFWNVHSGPGIDCLFFLYPWVEIAHCWQAVGGPEFVVPCIVGGMAWSQKRAGFPRIISPLDLCFTTENSITILTFSFPSWTSTVNGMLMVSSGHSLCPVKLTSGDRVGGFRFFSRVMSACRGRRYCGHRRPRLARSNVVGCMRRLRSDLWGPSRAFAGLPVRNLCSKYCQAGRRCYCDYEDLFLFDWLFIRFLPGSPIFLFGFEF